MKSIYPQFYKKGSKCIMREGDTSGAQVEIPEACKMVTLIHTRITLPNKKRFDEMVRGMEMVTQEVYEKYVSIFYQIRRKQPKLLNISSELLKKELAKQTNTAVSAV